MNSTHPVSDSVSVPRVVAGLIIDYLRWTQLVPMVSAWAFLLLMVGAILLVSFQHQSFSLIERGVTTYERVFGPVETAPASPPTPPDSVPGETENGGMTFSGDDFMPWVLKAWSVLALGGWLLGMLSGLVFGPREPMRLKRKLQLAAVPAVVCAGLFFLAYFLGSEEFHGSAAGWVLMFTGFPLGVWVVSAYCLAVAHALDLFRRRVIEPG